MAIATPKSKKKRLEEIEFKKQQEKVASGDFSAASEKVLRKRAANLARRKDEARIKKEQQALIDQKELEKSTKEGTPLGTKEDPLKAGSKLKEGQTRFAAPEDQPSNFAQAVEKTALEVATEQEEDIAERQFASDVQTQTGLLKTQKEQLDLEKKKLGQQAIAQKGLVTFQTAQSREGSTDTTSAGLRQVFGQDVEQATESRQLQLQSFQTRIEQADRDLALAIEKKDNIAVKNAAAAAAKIKKDLQEELEKDESEKTTNLLNLINSTDGSLLGVTANEMNALAAQTGIPAFMFSTIQASQVQAFEKTGLERQNAILDLQLKNLEISNFADSKLSNAGKLFNERQGLIADGATAAELTVFDEFAGADRTDTFKIGDDVWAYNKVTQETKKIIDNSGSNALTPTGQLASTEINGKKITLDSAALQSLIDVNNELTEDGLELRTGSIIDSSFRNQAGTIKRMTDRYNSDFSAEIADGQIPAIFFDPENPNKAAAELTARDYQVAAVGASQHEKGLALDILDVNSTDNSAEYIASVKPILESNGWTQPLPVRDPGHFEFKGRAGRDKASDAVVAQADSIMASTSATTSGLSTKDNFKGKVEIELGKRQQEFREKGDIENVLRASAGGARPSDQFLQSLTKGKTVVVQLQELARVLGEEQDEKAARKIKDPDGESLIDWGPISGWVRSKNPWDKSAQEINAIIQGAVPNLARGIFGEVGVLTDRDIELYRKTLPNLAQTGVVQMVIAGLITRVVRTSLENALLTQADNGRNVSGNVRFLGELDEQVKLIETRLGIVDDEEEIVDREVVNSAETTSVGIDETDSALKENAFDEINQQMLDLDAELRELQKFETRARTDDVLERDTFLARDTDILKKSTEQPIGPTKKSTL